MSASSRAAAEWSAGHGLLLATAAATLWGTVGIASTLLPDGVTLSPSISGSRVWRSPRRYSCSSALSSSGASCGRSFSQELA